MTAILEPGAVDKANAIDPASASPTLAVQLSIAISLKRIADALEVAPPLRPLIKQNP